MSFCRIPSWVLSSILVALVLLLLLAGLWWLGFFHWGLSTAAPYRVRLAEIENADLYAQPERSEPRRPNLVYLYLVFAALGGGFLRLLRIRRLPIWLRVLKKEVATALLVGAFVAFTFEMSLHKEIDYQHEQHHRDIEKDLFRAVLGRDIEKDVFDEMYEAVFGKKFLREDLCVTCEFRSCYHRDPLFAAMAAGTVSLASAHLGKYSALMTAMLLSARADHSFPEKRTDYVRVRTTVSYRIRNLSKDLEKFPVPLQFYNGFRLEGEKDFFESLTVEDHVGRPVLTLPTDRLAFTQKGNERKVTIPALVDILPGQALTVRLVYDMVKRHWDTYSWETGFPAKGGICLRAIIGDDGVSDLEFEEGGAHRAHAVHVAGGGNKAKVDEWRITQPLLPGQGIQLFWYPKART